MSQTSKEMNIVIWGAGNVGRMVAYILSYQSEVRVRAFLDDNADQIGRHLEGVPVVNPEIETLMDLKKESVSHGIVAIGNGRQREKLSQRLEEMGFQIYSAIHPSAQVSPPAQVGKGAIVLANANLSFNPVLGNYVFVASSATVAHDSRVDDNVEICAGVVIGARVHIKKNVYIANGVNIVPKNFGSLCVGEDAVIGAGAVVLEDVPPKAVVVGAPARIIRYQHIE